MTLCQQGLGEDIFSSTGHKVKNLVRFGIGEWRAALREAFSRRNVLASRRFWFSHLRMVYHCHNAPDGPLILMKPICPVFLPAWCAAARTAVFQQDERGDWANCNHLVHIKCLSTWFFAF